MPKPKKDFAPVDNAYYGVEQREGKFYLYSFCFDGVPSERRRVEEGEVTIFKEMRKSEINQMILMRSQIGDLVVYYNEGKSDRGVAVYGLRVNAHDLIFFNFV